MKTRVRDLFNGNKFCGVEISKAGIESGHVDYETLAKCVGNKILNNYVMRVLPEYWEMENGTLYDEENDFEYEIYQFYIITESGAEFLEEFTNEIVYYNSELNMYVWGITHLGTGWSYVMTDIEIPREE